MRWIQRRHPFTRICSGSSSIIKNVPDFAIFNSLLTDSFIYSQNLPREGKYTYLMRWIQWYHPFCRISSGSSPVTKNVPIFCFKIPFPGRLSLRLELPSRGYLGIFDALNSMVKSISPQPHWFIENLSKFVNFGVFLTQWRRASNCSMHAIPGRI